MEGPDQRNRHTGQRQHQSTCSSHGNRCLNSTNQAADITAMRDSHPTRLRQPGNRLILVFRRKSPPRLLCHLVPPGRYSIYRLVRDPGATSARWLTPLRNRSAPTLTICRSIKRPVPDASAERSSIRPSGESASTHAPPSNDMAVTLDHLGSQRPTAKSVTFRHVS